MRRILALALIAVLTGSSSPLIAAAGAQAPASIAGTATTSSGQTMANATVQLRNLATGQLTGSTTSSAAGQFSFLGLNPGNYAIEVVNAAGQIVGTSASISVAAGAAVTGVSVTATAAVAAGAAAGGAAAGAAAATGISTAVVVTTVAAAAGVAGIVAVAANASPSR